MKAWFVSVFVRLASFVSLTEGDVRLVAEHLVLATLLVRAPQELAPAVGVENTPEGICAHQRLERGVRGGKGELGQTWHQVVVDGVTTSADTDVGGSTESRQRYCCC